MNRRFVLALLLACAACSEDDVPAGATAEEPQQAATLAAATAPFAEGRFAPRDECSAIAGAADFRTRLAEAVRLRDADALAALAAEDVKLDFGGGAGRDTLRERLTDPDYKLWEELDELLTLGCAANDQGGISLPWMWEQDTGDADAFTTFLVMGEDEPVRAGASASAEQIATVSWDLVEVAEYKPDAAFMQVKLPDGRSGFIASDKLRSLVDYRLMASPHDGEWRIDVFIAGD